MFVSKGESYWVGIYHVDYLVYGDSLDEAGVFLNVSKWCVVFVCDDAVFLVDNWVEWCYWKSGNYARYSEFVTERTLWLEHDWPATETLVSISIDNKMRKVICSPA